ncbi:hypothetical protein EWM64_g6749 [Hericium alpestre]|uniref:Uncharacterized protein n=1 Tax=Hericium alpestre TaxID=135208 RepID=A0A4Y9ZR62_9AGAM|nr:hypothetical protein EWM64_g6749 [Hericium alpestre]
MESSGGDTDKLLHILEAGEVLKHGENAQPIYHDKDHVLNTIDAIDAGKTSWDTFSVQYTGPVDAQSASWKWQPPLDLEAGGQIAADPDTRGAMVVPIILGVDKTTILVATDHTEFHLLIKGTFKDHLVTWVEEYLHEEHSNAEADRIMDDIDRRIAAAPAFPGLRHFLEGHNFKQWTGDDLKALMKIIRTNTHLSKLAAACTGFAVRGMLEGDMVSTVRIEMGLDAADDHWIDDNADEHAANLEDADGPRADSFMILAMKPGT